MDILNRRTVLELIGAGAALAATGLPAHAALAPAQVFTADAANALVDSTVVLGEEKAMVIDAQMTAPMASKLADMIAATGRSVETIFITHYHPDHVLGLDVLMQRFPDARPVAHAAVQPKIAATAAGMLAGMSQGAPKGVFAEKAVIPEALSGDTLTLEGERFDIVGPLHGDTELITAVHMPQLDTLVAADLVYADTHAWVEGNQTPEQISAWRASLDVIERLGAGTVIPGHRLDDTVNDATTIAKTRAYLDQWEIARGAAKSADELRAMMMEGNAALGLGMALDRAIAAAFPG